jgi:hypothetical protein
MWWFIGWVLYVVVHGLGIICGGSWVGHYMWWFMGWVLYVVVLRMHAEICQGLQGAIKDLQYIRHCKLSICICYVYIIICQIYNLIKQCKFDSL